MTRIAASRPGSVGPTVLTPASASLPGSACTDEPDRMFQGEDEPHAAWVLRQAALVEAVCGICPVKWICRREAIERGERHGVWGGLTEDELREVRSIVRKRGLGVAA